MVPLRIPFFLDGKHHLKWGGRIEKEVEEKEGGKEEGRER